MATTLQIRHTVQSFADWKPVYDGHEPTRRQHGASAARVLHDGNAITVLIDFPDRASAEGFASDPATPEVMSKAGVVGAPEISFLEPVEEISY